MSQFAPIRGPRRDGWREQLDEMERLACATARGGPPTRGDATAYLDARSALLGSEIAAMLPGFLIQCHSIHRLREFLTLYDPETEMRERFMARAFARFREVIGEEPPAKPTLTPKEWMS